MDKTVTTALLLIASVVAALALTNAFLPAVSRGSGALLTASAAVAERTKTDIQIVLATDNASANQIFAWMKNVGTEEVKAIDKSDLFLTTPSVVKRFPYATGTDCQALIGEDECWTYSLEEGATNWTQTKTIKVTIQLTSVASGVYEIKFIVPNGASAEKEFSV